MRIIRIVFIYNACGYAQGYAPVPVFSHFSGIGDFSRTTPAVHALLALKASKKTILVPEYRYTKVSFLRKGT